MNKYRVILRESFMTMAFDFDHSDEAAEFAEVAIKTHKKRSEKSEKLSVEWQIVDENSDPKAYLDMSDEERKGE